MEARQLGGYPVAELTKCLPNQNFVPSQGRRNWGGAGGTACPPNNWPDQQLSEKKRILNPIKIDQNRGLPPQYFERSAEPGILT